MNYLQVKISVSNLGIEEITALLLDFNIKETMIEGSEAARNILEEKEKYYWDYVESEVFDEKETFIIFYLEEKQSEVLENIKAKILNIKNADKSGAFGKQNTLGTLDITVEIIPDTDWINSYKEHFKSVILTDSLRVQPTWEESNKEDFLHTVYLDPGMAFGTGTHETTSLCAEFLEYANCMDKKILDIGTGSGILAIAAAKLGAEKVLAIDIDPVAVDVARENTVLNKCDDKVEVIEGDLTKGIEFKGDIVVANLIAEIIVVLAKSVSKYMERDGLFISSGILTEKKNMVIEALEKEDFKIQDIKEKGEWCSILCRRENE